MCMVSLESIKQIAPEIDGSIILYYSLSDGRKKFDQEQNVSLKEYRIPVVLCISIWNL